MIQMKGQLTLFEPDFINDRDCTRETPVIHGGPDEPIYGTGKRLTPRLPGRTDSDHMRNIFLSELLPLEEYDLIAVLFSGGKDSVACYYKLVELGVPKEKMEIWHHDIDGRHSSRRMDWRCTQNYVSALAEAEGIPFRPSWRVNGFFGELYRIGASEPVEWMEPDSGEICQCRPTQNYLKCLKLKEQAAEDMERELQKLGYRMKFPAKTGDLSRRWCSAYLKIMVADTVMSNLDRLGKLEQLGGNLKAAVQDNVTSNPDKTKTNVKVLVVSGERRGESIGRSKYNEMEIHRTNADKKAHRIVHQWRPVIDYSEKDVWEVLKRHKINPHHVTAQGGTAVPVPCAFFLLQSCLPESENCILRSTNSLDGMKRTWDLPWIINATWIHSWAMPNLVYTMGMNRHWRALSQVSSLLMMCM